MMKKSKRTTSLIAILKKRFLKKNNKKKSSVYRLHRSFRLTKKRDYERQLNMPGYVSFTVEVARTIWSRKWLFLWLSLLYAAVVVIAGGMLSQSTYIQIEDVVATTGEGASRESGVLGVIGEAGTVFLSSIGTPGSLNDAQQIYLAIALMLVWLTSVWLLREMMAGRRPKLRDGLYNAAAPFVSTSIIFLLLVIQIIPLAFVAILYAGLSGIGLANQGFGAMLSYILIAAVAGLTLYWTTSTFIALVVVTLPGMYPVQALRAANQLVVSRRLRIMYRLLWLVGGSLLIWTLIMIPLIILEAKARDLWSWVSHVPIIPFSLTLLGAITTVWFASYVYLLYRKLVDDESVPGRKSKQL